MSNSKKVGNQFTCMNSQVHPENVRSGREKVGASFSYSGHGSLAVDVGILGYGLGSSFVCDGSYSSHGVDFADNPKGDNCIGLDGIRMLGPSTSSRTLRIYPLDTVYDSSTLVFWSKSSVDIEPRHMPKDHQQKTMAMKQKNNLFDELQDAFVKLDYVKQDSIIVPNVSFSGLLLASYHNLSR
ncbi:hypothetical protein Tco_0918555 [Tanacetum coccineum]